MDVIVERTAKALEASACAVFTIGPEDRATQLAGSGYQKPFNGKSDVKVLPAKHVPEEPARGEELGLTGWILSTGKPFLASGPEDVRRHPHYSARPQPPQEQIDLQSFLGVPIRGLEGEVIGLVKAERRLGDPEVPGRAFSEQDQLALETVARVASRGITYLNVARKGKETQAITAWARDVIAEAASTEGELDAFLDLVVKVTAAAMGADSCGIFLKDESGNTLTQRAGFGPSQELREVIRAYRWPDQSVLQDCMDPTRCNPPACPKRRCLPREVRTGLTAWIAATGKSFLARNFQELSAHCHHRGEYDPVNFPVVTDTECGAFLGIPLRVGDTILGVVKVENTLRKGQADGEAFPREAEQRFEVLAQDIALAVMRLQIQIPARYQIMRDAQETIVEILRGGLEVPDLVDKVVKETARLFHAGACALFLKDGNRLIQPRRAATGWAERGPEVREYELVPLEAIKDDPAPHEKVGLTVWIAVRQKGFTAKSNTELRMHPHHIGRYDPDNFPEGQRCESFMGLPLLIKEGDRHELIGVLKVETKKRTRGDAEECTYFNELDARVFELIANSAAIAIQNARLLDFRRKAAWVSALQQSSRMVTHKLRNILPIVSDYLCELLEEAVPSGGGEHATRVALEETRRAQRIVTEFESFAKSEAFERPDILRPAELVERLRQEVQSSLQQTGCPVEVTVCPEVLTVQVNMDRLRDDFVAFAGDSKRHCSSGLGLRIAGEVAGDSDIARVGLPVEKRYLKLTYSDNGPGVARELKDKIFEPFFTTGGGSGLGLAIAAYNARVHGGRIVEAGEPGRGVRFEIYLPERG